MRRLLDWLTRINAFRIGLLTGLAFAALHVLQIAGRADVPVLTRMEGALTDLRFLQRVSLFGSSHSGQVVIAAIDEAAIARFGRFPWDRRVLASLVDKLDGTSRWRHRRTAPRSSASTRPSPRSPARLPRSSS